MVLKRLALEQALRQRDAYAVTMYEAVEVRRHMCQSVLMHIYYEDLV